jgi:simple sugar transport system substrate-binding protein
MVPVYTQMVEDLKADKFGTHEYSISLKDNSVQLLHTKHIPDDVWASLEDLRKKIIDGSVKVDRIEDAQKVRALMSTVDPGPAQ